MELPSSSTFFSSTKELKEKNTISKSVKSTIKGPEKKKKKKASAFVLFFLLKKRMENVYHPRQLQSQPSLPPAPRRLRSSPKMERRIIEKNRRNYMKGLYSALFSLLPCYTSKVCHIYFPLFHFFC